MKIFLLAMLLGFGIESFAQDNQTLSDTVGNKILDEVMVSAFNYQRPWLKTAAAIGQLSSQDFSYFNDASMLSAVNTIPGVRMEERSPGSYRFSIRGSTMRSPFGVRNVKIYLNGLPFTDPGGNTYLNLLDLNTIQSAEVVKGPGSSMYGAGTGGALLLKGSGGERGENSFSTSATIGSFGYQHYLVQADFGEENDQTTIQYAHQQADGYRDQSQMERDVLYARFNGYIDTKQKITTTLLFSDLYYQTPGGLTKTQMNENPRQARPAAGPNPSAEEQQAAIYNKTFYLGIAHEFNWNDKLKSVSGVYGTNTNFKNPSIRNYEKRTEQSLGFRSVTDYLFTKGKLTVGIEYQAGFSPVKTYANNQGIPNGIQTDDEIRTTTYSLFAQSVFSLPYQFEVTIGGSLNGNKVEFERLSVTPPDQEERKFDAIFSPRIALQKGITENLFTYFSFSQGFSPPAVAELYPSTNEFNQTLAPEKGLNYELGLKGFFAKKKIAVELVGYVFNLSETIVVRRDQSGADFFRNAGETNQEGIELTIKYFPVLSTSSFLSTFNLWAGYSLNAYQYKNFQQDVDDYSGNQMPGIAPNTLLAGLNATSKIGIYANTTFQYVDAMWLNDANTESAESYSLLGMRIGFKNRKPVKLPFEIFLGAENLLNEHYSLGNDLNAFGGRYYNPASTRNYYAGLKISVMP